MLKFLLRRKMRDCNLLIVEPPARLAVAKANVNRSLLSEKRQG